MIPISIGCFGIRQTGQARCLGIGILLFALNVARRIIGVGDGAGDALNQLYGI